VPGYRHDVWSAVLMPAKVPPAIVGKAGADIARVFNAPETSARLAAQGIDVVTSSSQVLGQLIREDYDRWGKVVRATGIKAE
jgi:tripartite-type tricarboxylate transporter receptor subunit TctC